MYSSLIAAVVKFASSKYGKVAMLVFVAVMVIGFYQLRISHLKNDLKDLGAENAMMKVRNKICESDRGILEQSVKRQNEVVEQLSLDKKRLEADASLRAVEKIRGAEEVEKIVNSGQGPEAMNDFIFEIFGGENE